MLATTPYRKWFVEVSTSNRARTAWWCWMGCWMGVTTRFRLRWQLAVVSLQHSNATYSDRSSHAALHMDIGQSQVASTPMQVTLTSCWSWFRSIEVSNYDTTGYVERDSWPVLYRATVLPCHDSNSGLRWFVHAEPLENECFAILM